MLLLSPFQKIWRICQKNNSNNTSKITEDILENIDKEEKLTTAEEHKNNSKENMKIIEVTTCKCSACLASEF
jgi:hypothetical protein